MSFRFNDSNSMEVPIGYSDSLPKKSVTFTHHHVIPNLYDCGAHI